jgi:hypothetical protein
MRTTHSGLVVPAEEPKAEKLTREAAAMLLLDMVRERATGIMFSEDCVASAQRVLSDCGEGVRDNTCANLLGHALTALGQQILEITRTREVWT